MLTDLTTSKFFKTEQIETAASVTKTAVSVTDAVFFVTQTAVSVTQTAVDRMRVRYDEQRAGCQRAQKIRPGPDCFGTKKPRPVWTGLSFFKGRVGWRGRQGETEARAVRRSRRFPTRFTAAGSSQSARRTRRFGGRVPLRFRRACKCRDLALRPELLTDYHLEVTL